MKISARAVIGLMVILSLCFSGCATMQGAATGAQQLLCNPTDAQKSAATVAITVIDGTLAVLQAVPNPTSAVAGLITSLGGARTVFSTVAKGGCVLSTQLAEALSAYDQGTAAKAMLVKAAPLQPVPEIQVLRDWATK